MTLQEMGLALAAGATLALVYFGGLFLTLCRLPQVRYRALLLFSSFVLRTALFATVMIRLAQRHVMAALPALVGFFLARSLILSGFSLLNRSRSGAGPAPLSLHK